MPNSPAVDIRTGGHQKTWAAVASVVCFVWAVYAAAFNKVNSNIQLVVFLATLSIGFGGLTSIVASSWGGRANVNLGWFKATGSYAFVFMILALLLHIFHVTNLREFTDIFSGQMQPVESSSPKNGETLWDNLAKTAKEWRSESPRKVALHGLKLPK